MKKPYVILWLLGILALCLPLSYLINVKVNTYSSDFNLLVPVCAAAAFLVIGGISWGASYFMKRKQQPNATRNALLIFTALVVSVSAVSAPEAAKKMKHRKAFLNKGSDMAGVENETVKAEPLSPEDRGAALESCIAESEVSLAPLLELQDIADKEEKIRNYCNCMLDKMDADPELIPLMEAATEEEMETNPKLNAMLTECMNELGLDLQAE